MKGRSASWPGRPVSEYADLAMHLIGANPSRLFFRARFGAKLHARSKTQPMPHTTHTMAQQIAQAASAFQQQRTGHAPKAVTVVLSENMLVIALHGALTPAEQALAANPTGAARVQEFHRQLFANSSDTLRQEIKRITGVDVREAAAEIETATGTVVHAFTSGTMVQVFLLAEPVSARALKGQAESSPVAADVESTI